MDVGVLVLGGGPAGCATALSLIDAGVAAADVLVVEASDYGQERIGESIPPDTRQLFDALGLLPALAGEGHEPCLGSASCWGSDELGYNDFVFNPHGHGWHLDRRRFDAWLAVEVERRGATVQRGCRLRDVIERGANGAVLDVGGRGSRRTRIEARFVVDASGMRSVYARRMGAAPRALDRLVSVAAVFRLPGDSGFSRLTLLEAVEYGWWYAARLPDRRIATALATSHALHKEHRFEQASTWRAALSGTRYLAPMLADCEFVDDSMSICTAPSFILDRVAGDHWLAVGDAAAAYDPISSQGIYKALSDGIAAGRLLAGRLRGQRAGAGLAGYRADMDERFAVYARQRAYFYDRERRWADAPFWRGRRDCELPRVPGGETAAAGSTAAVRSAQ